MERNGLLNRFFDREKNQYDYEDLEGYRLQLRLYLIIHLCLEVLYIWCRCTPMAIWNVLSIGVYLAQMFYAERKDCNTAVLVWVSDLEIYTHSVLATVVMGYGCGFHLWLFGLVLSIIVPYQTPMRSGAQRIVARLYFCVFAITAFAFPLLNYYKVLPVRYNPPESVQAVLCSLNALVACCAILLYTTVTLFGAAKKEILLSKAADTDYLTGLYNRQHMQNLLYQSAPDQENLCIAIMDIDHFKNINDTYGHMAGDYVLKEISRMLHKTMDQHLTVGRWGGEEFLFIAEGGYSLEEFSNRLEKLRKEISDFKFVFSDIDINVTASFGAAKHREDMSKQDLVKLADDRLYAAKESGRNQVAFSDK